MTRAAEERVRAERIAADRLTVQTAIECERVRHAVERAHVYASQLTCTCCTPWRRYLEMLNIL